MQQIRAIVIDNNRKFLEAASRCLSSDPRLEVVESTSSGYEALKLAAELQPDLFLIGLALPDISSLEVVRRLRKLQYSPKILLMTLYDNVEFLSSAKIEGADGYIDKMAFARSILPTINSLFPGPCTVPKRSLLEDQKLIEFVIREK